MLFSVIIPVYNRPAEVKELLESLAVQTFGDFEVVVVEDGSEQRCEEVVGRFKELMKVAYFEKQNEGPGMARNYGTDRSIGKYMIYLDSDCIAPPTYLENVAEFLETHKADIFGGPDAAREDFTDMQKAINYSMTSFFTTGGIRGGNHRLDNFIPRSFNMGYRREVYNMIGGFSTMRFGEDIELSYRVIGNGYTSALIPQAEVYHKRRNDEKSFFKQVFFSGLARINLYRRYPGTLRVVHLLPALFTVYTAAALVTALFFWGLALFPLLVLAGIWFFDSLRTYRNVNISLMAVETSFIQLLGYGCGFLTGIWKRMILGQSEEETYKTKFY